jgi:hypothetical protein
VSVARRVGWVLIGAGCGGLVAAATFGVLGRVQNGSVTSGGFASRADIQQTIDVGQRYNVAAWTSLGVGAGVLATGALLAALNLDPGPSRLSISPITPAGPGLSASISFQ